MIIARGSFRPGNTRIEMGIEIEALLGWRI